jgi:hypothetical protein
MHSPWPPTKRRDIEVLHTSTLFTTYTHTPRIPTLPGTAVVLCFLCTVIDATSPLQERLPNPLPSMASARSVMALNYRHRTAARHTQQSGPSNPSWSHQQQRLHSARPGRDPGEDASWPLTAMPASQTAKQCRPTLELCNIQSTLRSRPMSHSPGLSDTSDTWNGHYA